MRNFWMISLCAFLIIASVTGWNIPIRIAVGANAAVVLIDVLYQIGGIIYERRTEKKKN